MTATAMELHRTTTTKSEKITIGKLRWLKAFKIIVSHADKLHLCSRKMIVKRVFLARFG